jgi:SAM-dependent methyltransferase
VASTSDRVAEFWNREAARFTAKDGARTSYHLEFAQVLNDALRGDVLCVGGLYAHVALDSRKLAMNVVDVSAQMLDVYASRGASARLGDARNLPIPDNSMDHVVFPLVLHHITADARTGEGAEAARANVALAFREAHRVLRPGGTLWAKEILVSPGVYWLERMLAPATRTVLASRGIPLVIFHSAGFYQTELAAAGFADPLVTLSTVSQGRWYEMVRPVIGLGLRVPRAVLPLRYALLRGTKPAQAVVEQDL